MQDNLQDQNGNTIPQNPNSATDNQPPVNMVNQGQNVQASNSSNDNGDLQKKIGIVLVIISVVFVIFAVLGVIIYIGSKSNSPNNGDIPGIDFEEDSAIEEIAESSTKNYFLDSDGDSFPDYFEKKAGLDPFISEYETCKNNGCELSELGDMTVPPKDSLIILDASGSMALDLGGEDRMSGAKRGIQQFVNNAAENANFGLMIYGHKGSNLESGKAVSCAGADIVSPIGELTVSNIDSTLSVVSSVGWTPMGLALRNAKVAFVNSNATVKEVLLVSDGEESCDTDPVGAAAELKEMGVQVNVIALAVSSASSDKLSAIAEAGGGSFSVANSYAEMLRAYEIDFENLKKVHGDENCIWEAGEQFDTCYTDAFDLVFDAITEEMNLALDNSGDMETWSMLQQLSSDISDRKSEIMLKEFEKTMEGADEAREQIVW